MSDYTFRSKSGPLLVSIVDRNGRETWINVHDIQAVRSGTLTSVYLLGREEAILIDIDMEDFMARLREKLRPSGL